MEWKEIFKKKKNKNVHIFNISFKQPLSNKNILNYLTYEEKQTIQNQFKNTNGLFLYDFENIKHSESIIFVNADIKNVFQFKQTTSHELIHYFQWATGRSIYEIKNVIENDQNNIKQLNEIFNINYDINSINNILNKHELVTYSFELFNYLKNRITNKRSLTLIIDQLFETFRFNRDTDQSFEEYWNRCINSDEIMFDETKQIIHEKNEKIMILVLSGFYGIEFNTIKNHVFAYLNK